MLAYDLNTITSDNCQAQKKNLKKGVFFIEVQENTTVGKSLGALPDIICPSRSRLVDWAEQMTDIYQMYQKSDRVI